MGILAIDGGNPVRKEFLPYGHQWIDDNDIDAVTQVLKTDWITQGPKVSEFEAKIANYCGAKYAVAMSNGTTALHAACSVAGISANDEVITTPISFAATANAIVYNHGKPVFADIREDTLNIDPSEIRKHLTSKTKALLPVDFAGHPADMEEIRTIASEKGLVIIEDACHAMGSEYRGHKTGSLADMCIFSFHPIKHITTGEGGMVLTNSRDFYEKLKGFRHHGIEKKDSEKSLPWVYEINRLGHNFRLTDFQCALGISQLNKLDMFVTKRREIAAKYTEAFSAIHEIITPVESDDVKSSYHIYVIQIRGELLTKGRKEIFEALLAENIGVNIHYLPIHLHPFYKREFGYKAGDFPKAERYYERAITLPIFPKMTFDDVESVIKAVQKVVEHYRKQR